MDKLIRPGRMVFMGLVVAALLTISVITLYKLQIIDGRAYYEESRDNVITYPRVVAARGNIMDRYGRVLVENRICNNLIIDEADLFRDDDKDWVNANATILTLCNTVTAFGNAYTDTLPITKSPPFEFTDMTEIQRVFLDAYLADKKLPSDTTAVELMAYMRDRYLIDNSYTAEETRIIAGIRYEINGRRSYGFNTSDYIFARDVSMDLITTLMENNVPGFDVQTSFIRDYNTSYAAHILGYTAMMDDADVEYYTKLNYPLDAEVGRGGAELAFEEYLHGTDGKARVTRTASGVVTSTVYTEETTPGDHVYLTIDIGLQETAENALNSFITAENDARTEKNAEIEQYGGNSKDIKQLISGGAAVAVDVATGEPLAIASWPNYDLTDLMRDYTAVANAENNPLFNRATSGTYAPGSTFKPCVAIAGLCEGKIDTGTQITDEGVFRKYEAYGDPPKCWIYDATTRATHGTIDLAQAITVSCNYYFYTVADYLQISLMAKYAKLFGLGESTGIEIGERTGVMTSDAFTQEHFGRDMYAGETLQAGIGQSYSEFTPLQLAEYCAAIANGGLRHSASILKSVHSYDFSKVVYQRGAELLSTVEAEPDYFETVRRGMRGVANDPINGSAYNIFSDASYPVAAKTGTAQRGEGQTNNAVFICFAPYENPEIAVAVVIEKGNAGSSLARIARTILDYYFAFKDSTVALEAEGMLLK